MGPSAAGWVLLACCLCLPVGLPGSDLLPSNILVFGGNGFMGSATVERLLQLGDSITIVNRGNWYWDSTKRIKPHVRHVACDRMQSLQKCTEFMHFLGGGVYFDTVVDFSAYHPFEITEALSALRGRVGLYVFISSDSVYEVCPKNHTGSSLETDAVRPADDRTRAEYAAEDDYGDRKLSCEEALIAQRRGGGGVPYIALRLPDVIGPRDNTYRLWIYQLWMKLRKYLERPVSIPGFLLTQPLSFVYVNDIVDVIVRCRSAGPEIRDQAFNLAFSETPTLHELLTEMKGILNLPEIDIDIEPGTSNSVYLFPSVKLGPLNTSRARHLLGWNPTPLHQAIEETMEFYERALTDPDLEVPRRDIIRLMQTYLTRRPLQVLVGLKQEYGLQYPLEKEEL